MDLKLNIYNRKEIVKTYVADTYDLEFGTVEDFIALIDGDNLDLNDTKSMLDLATRIVTKGMDFIKPLLMDIFEGITDDELRHTKVKEIALLLIMVIKSSVTELTKGADPKN